MNRDDEDYYEYSDEEDQLDYTPSRSQNDNIDEYQIKESLRPPRGTSYSVHHLYTQTIGREIDLSAVYQRDVVWDDDKQIAIIDSIFRNYYVPPIIFSVKPFDDGTEVRHCIDGKQRLTSIRRFMDGEIPHRDARTKERVWFKENPKFGPTRKKLLPEGVKATFTKKQIVCVEYDGLTFDQERDVFQRVQLGVPLTAPEKLNVIFTPRANLTRDLITTTFGNNKEGIGRQIEEKEVNFNPKRGRSFHVVTLALCLLTKWNAETGVKTFPGVSTLETWLKESRNGGTMGRKGRGKGKAAANPGSDEAVEVPQEFKDRIKNAARTLVELVKDPKCTVSFRQTQFSQKVSPIEMTGILMLIYLLRDQNHLKVTFERLSQLIVLLRADMHRKNPGRVLLNAGCWRTVAAFILEAVKDPEGFWEKKVNDGSVAWAGIQVTSLKRPKEEESENCTSPKRSRITAGSGATSLSLSRLTPASTASARSPPLHPQSSPPVHLAPQSHPQSLPTPSTPSLNPARQAAPGANSHPPPIAAIQTAGSSKTGTVTGQKVRPFAGSGDRSSTSGAPHAGGSGG